MCLAHTQVRYIMNSPRSEHNLIINRRAMREIDGIKKDAVHLKQRVAEIQTKLSTVIYLYSMYQQLINSELIVRWRPKLKNLSTF
jgi:hypothetical protein